MALAAISAPPSEYGPDAEEAADVAGVAVAGLPVPRAGRGVGWETELGGEVAADVGGHALRARQSPEPLVAFQEDEEDESPPVAPSARPDEGELVVGRPVEGLDLGARERGPKAGVGSAFDGTA